MPLAEEGANFFLEGIAVELLAFVFLIPAEESVTFFFRLGDVVLPIEDSGFAVERGVFFFAMPVSDSAVGRRLVRIKAHPTCWQPANTREIGSILITAVYVLGGDVLIDKRIKLLLPIWV